MELDEITFPAAVYMRAQEEITEFDYSPDQTDDLSVISDLLEEELVSAINDLEVSDDAEQAEAQLRATVHKLQLTAFVTGLLWQQAQDRSIEIYDHEREEELVLDLSSEQRLEFAKAMLNGTGFSLTLK